MKTVRILGIIVILALIGGALKDAIPGFIDGWNDAETDSQLVLPADFNSVSLSVDGYKDGIPDSLFNRAMQANVPCEVNGVNTYVKHNSWVHAMGFVILPVILLVFYGVYCLICLLISVSRGEILIRKNIRRLRFFIYPIMAFSALYELQNYILYRIATSELVEIFVDFHVGDCPLDRDFRPSGTHQRRERFNHINKHFRSACLLALKSNIYFIASFSTTETPLEDIFNGKRRYIRLRRHVNRL